MHFRRNGGISLIDVMIVLATMAVLAVLIVPQYNAKKAREVRELKIAQARADLLALKLAEELYFEKHGRFTSNPEKLSAIRPSVASLKCPFDNSEYQIMVPDTSRFDIKCSTEDPGAIEGGLPNWISDPGQESTRAVLIRRSRERLEKIRAAQEKYFEAMGHYTDIFDSLETVSPGVTNLICPLVMKRYSIAMSDSVTYEITSHLDEVGRIVAGKTEYPPLPEPKAN